MFNTKALIQFLCAELDRANRLTIHICPDCGSKMKIIDGTIIICPKGCNTPEPEQSDET